MMQQCNEHTFILPETTHGQFYLIDDESDPDTSNIWNDEAFQTRLAITDGCVGISTLQYIAEIEVTLVVGRSCTEEERAGWDHVAACSLEVRSGRLRIEPCLPMSDDEIHMLPLEPGCYRLCILCDWFDIMDIDEFDPKRERYKVFLWRAAYRPVELIKRRG